jgi:hypothetical protein
LRGRLGGLVLLAWLLDNWPKHLASINVAETVTGGTYPPGVKPANFHLGRIEELPETRFARRARGSYA